MDIDTMIALWNKYKNYMNRRINKYTQEELQEMSDVALLIPAQAKHLGLNQLDHDTYIERYTLYVKHLRNT